MRGQDASSYILHGTSGQRQEALSDAWRRAWIGCPEGNKNALKHGLYTREAIEERRRLKQLIRQAENLLEEIR